MDYIDTANHSLLKYLLFLHLGYCPKFLLSYLTRCTPHLLSSKHGSARVWPFQPFCSLPSLIPPVLSRIMALHVICPGLPVCTSSLDLSPEFQICNCSHTVSPCMSHRQLNPKYQFSGNVGDREIRKRTHENTVSKVQTVSLGQFPQTTGVKLKNRKA